MSSSSAAAVAVQDVEEDSPAETSQGSVVDTPGGAPVHGGAEAAPKLMATNNGGVAGVKRSTPPPTGGEDGHSTAAAAAVAAAAGADCSNNSIRCSEQEVALINDSKKANVPAAVTAAVRKDRNDTECPRTNSNTKVMEVDDDNGDGEPQPWEKTSSSTAAAEAGDTSFSRAKAAQEHPRTIAPPPPAAGYDSSSMMSRSEEGKHRRGDDGFVRKSQDAMQVDQGSTTKDDERGQHGVMEEHEGRVLLQQVCLVWLGVRGAGI